jgi:hypothetical protein
MSRVTYNIKHRCFIGDAIDKNKREYWLFGHTIDAPMSDACGFSLRVLSCTPSEINYDYMFSSDGIFKHYGQLVKQRKSMKI